MSTVLLTGGAGYIGSHTAVPLLSGGYEVVIADNFSNSSKECIRRVEMITGKKVTLYDLDVCDGEALDGLFYNHSIDAVIHFAGLKAVGESFCIPLRYYKNNLGSTMTLLEVMDKHGVKQIVFSSSATVYGIPEKVPVDEIAKTGSCTNPYGWTKQMGEQIFRDACVADKELSVVLLRYFNPIGAHESGLIGESPHGSPNNLMPYISQVAVGKRKELHVFGNDYDTHDGTGVRDYIHVMDLAEGHVAAVRYAENHAGTEVFNLGTGCGYSVLDLVKTFEKVNGINIPYVIDPRRSGDIAACYADPSKAKIRLGWSAKRNLDDMCRDSWNWQKNNPNGYEQ